MDGKMASGEMKWRGLSNVKDRRHLDSWESEQLRAREGDSE